MKRKVIPEEDKPVVFEKPPFTSSATVQPTEWAEGVRPWKDEEQEHWKGTI